MSGAIEAVTNLLFVEKNIIKADLALVLGNNWVKTMDEVKEYRDRGFFDKILISGHSVKKDLSPEAIRFRDYGLSIGLPEDCFLLEKESTNTKENFEFSIPVIEREIGFENVKSLLLVTKNFHMRRVWMTALRFFPKGITYGFLPITDERNILPDNWWKDDSNKRRVLAELKRIYEYTVNGDISLE